MRDVLRQVPHAVVTIARLVPKAAAQFRPKATSSPHCALQPPAPLEVHTAPLVSPKLVDINQVELLYVYFVKEFPKPRS
jgi:hypothetical protein